MQKKSKIQEEKYSKEEITKLQYKKGSYNKSYKTKKLFDKCWKKHAKKANKERGKAATKVFMNSKNCIRLEIILNFKINWVQDWLQCHFLFLLVAF